MTDRDRMDLGFAIAQLRHLYRQMLAGQVRNAGEAAAGLLGPSIEVLERMANRQEGASGN